MMEDECLCLEIDIVRILLESAKHNDSVRAFGYLRPPSKLSRELSEQLEKAKDKLREMRKVA